MIYLDNAATTRMFDAALEEKVRIEKYFYANSAARHKFALESEIIIDEARRDIANYLNCNKNEVFFTRGASESNNIALQSFAGTNYKVITNKLEHSSVYETIKNKFSDIYYIENDEAGNLKTNQLSDINGENFLISIMHVNNELGIINDVKSISSIIRKYNKNVIIHCDGTQAFGKFDVDVNKLGVDIYTFSAHKIHGPKACGGMYIKKGIQKHIKPLLLGGLQEVFSSGTVDVSSIGAFKTALNLMQHTDKSKIKRLKRHFIKRLSEIEDIMVLSPPEKSSDYILNVAFKDIKSEVLLHFLEQEEIFVSSQSACSKNEVSRVIENLDLDKNFNQTLRFSFSEQNSIEEIDFTIQVLKSSVEMIRKVIK